MQTAVCKADASWLQPDAMMMQARCTPVANRRLYRRCTAVSGQMQGWAAPMQTHCKSMQIARPSRPCAAQPPRTPFVLSLSKDRPCSCSDHSREMEPPSSNTLRTSGSTGLAALVQAHFNRDAIAFLQPFRPATRSLNRHEPPCVTLERKAHQSHPRIEGDGTVLELVGPDIQRRGEPDQVPAHPAATRLIGTCTLHTSIPPAGTL